MAVWLLMSWFHSVPEEGMPVPVSKDVLCPCPFLQFLYVILFEPGDEHLSPIMVVANAVEILHPALTSTCNLTANAGPPRQG